MLKPLMITALALAPATLGAQAMSDSERDAFRAEVRAYLLENPEVIMEAIGVLQERERLAEAAAEIEIVQANAAALFDDPTSFVGGNPNGDITIVEFMDYRCGYCKRAFPEVASLIRSDGNIRYIVKEFPILGEQSLAASQFALAARQVHGDDTYKIVHDALMEYRGDITEATLTRLSDSLALDTDQIFAAMDSSEVTDIIDRNRALAQTLQISGTPTFIVESQLVRGYLPLDQMQSVVAEERG